MFFLLGLQGCECTASSVLIATIDRESDDSIEKTARLWVENIRKKLQKESSNVNVFRYAPRQLISDKLLILLGKAGN